MSRLLLLLPLLLCACAGAKQSGFGDRDEDQSADEGPTVYGRISVSVDAINHD
jgi:hypothetical protein